jgi:hypothetical protein
VMEVSPNLNRPSFGETLGLFSLGERIFQAYLSILGLYLDKLGAIELEIAHSNLTCSKTYVF